MRDASPECIAYLDANNVAFRADLVTLTLATGAVYRWTTWNQNLTVQNHNRGDTHTFYAPPNAPIVEIGAQNDGDGLSVSTMDLILSGQAYQIGGKSLMIAATDGDLDGAEVVVDHLIMPTEGDVSLKSFIDWDGRVEDPDIGVSTVTLRCKSWLASAETTPLPRRTIAPNCPHEHFGPACGLNRDDWVQSGMVSGGVSVNGFTAAGLASGFYSFGVVRFADNTATVALRGLRADIAGIVYAGAFLMASPLPVAPQAGDTFQVWPGCPRAALTLFGVSVSLDQSVCASIYGNFAKFGGFPYVPPNTSTPVR